MALRYLQRDPSARVASVVECYWLLEGEGAGVAEPILPDGRIELIFHYGAPFTRHHPGGAVETQPAAIVAGQITAPVLLSHRGRAGVAAIRLRPAAARAVVRMSAAELTGQLAPLDAIFSASGSSPSQLCTRLAEARSAGERIALLEEWILRRVASRAPRPEIDAAVTTIIRSGGTAPVTTLTRRSGLGRRQLERLFLEEVGLPAKTLARLVRLQRALRLLRGNHAIVDVAASCGYYDQAHMALDFRRLADGSPSHWQEHGGELAALFAGA
jgi:AraC-like DNA-binding protein